MTERFMEEAVVAYLKLHPGIESNKIYKKYDKRYQLDATIMIYYHK